MFLMLLSGTAVFACLIHGLYQSLLAPLATIPGPRWPLYFPCYEFISDINGRGYERLAQMHERYGTYRAGSYPLRSLTHSQGPSYDLVARKFRSLTGASSRGCTLGATFVTPIFRSSIVETPASTVSGPTQ